MDHLYLTATQHAFVMTEWLPRLIAAEPKKTVTELYATAAKSLHDIEEALSETASNVPGTNTRLSVNMPVASDGVLRLINGQVVRRV